MAGDRKAAAAAPAVVECGFARKPGESHFTERAFQPHFMLVPSLACPAECSYCFGPHQGPIMSPKTMDAALDFITRVVRKTHQRKAKVTFHGGEPLVAGHASGRFGPAALPRAPSLGLAANRVLKQPLTVRPQWVCAHTAPKANSHQIVLVLAGAGDDNHQVKRRDDIAPFPILVPGAMRESGLGSPAGPEGGAEPRPDGQPAPGRAPRA